MRADREKVQMAMARACMSTADLVNQTGMPSPTVSKVIGGHNVLPVTLGTVARALNVDPADLIADTDSERRTS